MATEYFKIAPGNNNPGDLKRLHQLSPPLFKDYKYFIVTWFDSDERERGGDRLLYNIGLPRVEITLNALYPDEMTYIKNNLEGLVTIRAENTITQVWGNYNGIFEIPAVNDGMQYQSGEWRENTFIIRDLMAL